MHMFQRPPLKSLKAKLPQVKAGRTEPKERMVVLRVVLESPLVAPPRHGLEAAPPPLTGLPTVPQCLG